MSQLDITRLSKSYGDAHVLQEISFSVEKGRVLSLLGPSGCGKTTTLRCIAGIVQPDSGTVKVGKRDITHAPIHTRRTTLLFQEVLLFPHLSVLENIAYGLRMQKIPKKSREQRALEMLDRVRLVEYAKRDPATLSGGQKQRVALARALVLEPEVLLMDEPFSSLDENLREDMRQLTFSLQKSLGITSVFVTHDREEAMRYSDAICVMQGGAILQTGTPQEIFRYPKSERVAAFMADYNRVEGEVRGGVFEAGALQIRVSEGDGKGVLMIHPEAIERAEDGTGAVGKVVSSRYLGTRTLLTLDFGGVRIKAITDVDPNLSEGGEVCVKWNFELIHYYANA